MNSHVKTLKSVTTCVKHILVLSDILLVLQFIFHINKDINKISQVERVKE